jgi:hypothetical protein
MGNRIAAFASVPILGAALATHPTRLQIAGVRQSFVGGREAQAIAAPLVFADAFDLRNKAGHLVLPSVENELTAQLAPSTYIHDTLRRVNQLVFAPS